MWWLAALAVGLFSLAHTAPFPFLLEFVGPGRSLWHAPSSGGPPVIYLTYDDGPNADATPALLDVLERDGVTATFFVIPRHVTNETAHILTRLRSTRTHAACC
jgi:peptidoglycan/xylan/chitin deacetylase (PgdA/CDA1 family)